MAFRDYSTTPSANTTLGDGTYVGANMLRNKVRPAIQQLMADGRALADEVAGVELSALEAVQDTLDDLVFTVTSATGQSVSTRTLLAGISSPVAGQVAYLTELRREGVFTWVTGNQSAKVTADPYQGLYVPPTTDTTGASGVWQRTRPRGYFEYGWFGPVIDDSAGEAGNTLRMSSLISLALAENVATIKLIAERFYAQIIVPGVANTAAGFASLCFVGATPPSQVVGTLATAVVSNDGTIICSLLTTGAVVSATAVSADFSFVRVILRDMEVRTYDNPQNNGVDLTYAIQCELDNVVVSTGIYTTQCTKPDASIATGRGQAVITPRIGNGAHTHLKNVIVNGFRVGFNIGEHSVLDNCSAFGCLYGGAFQPANHASAIKRLGLYRCTYPLVTDGVHYVAECNIAIEHVNPLLADQVTNPADLTQGNGWQVTATDLTDIGNQLHGDIIVDIVKGGVGPDTTFTMSAGCGYVNVRRAGEASDQSVCVFSRTTNQTVVSGVATPLTFQASSLPPIDPCAALKSGDATTIVLKKFGMYRIAAPGIYDAAATGQRQIQITKGGTAFDYDVGLGDAVYVTKLRSSVDALGATPGEEVKVVLLHDRGSDLVFQGNATSGSVTVTRIKSVPL